MENTPTIHNNAKYGDIADVVIMPGDPKRAKYIAENFLENAKCFNELRGMLGYTGNYKGKRVSVMGSGMGIPSMGIYSFELYKFYDVKKIIRIGSCGSYNGSINILDICLVDKCFCEGNFALTLRNSKSHIIGSSNNLNKEIIKKCNAITVECFEWYTNKYKMLKRIPKDFKYDVSEMEAYALLNTAKMLNREAACLLTVADSHVNNKKVSAKQRECAFNNMIKLALETITK